MARDSDRYKRSVQAYKRHTGLSHETGASPYDPPAMEDLSRITFEGTYGDSWSRPGLDFRTKSFVCLAVTAALGTESQFKTHMKHAHHTGITKDEIVELLIHLNGYIGTPRTSVARRLAREVWQESAEKASLRPKRPRIKAT